MKQLIEKNLSLLCSVQSSEGRVIPVIRVKHTYRKLRDNEIKKVSKDTGKTAKELKNMYIFEPEVNINRDEFDKIIFSTGGENFTIDFDILSGNEKIGRVSVSNICVRSKKAIRSYVEEKMPTSKSIAERLCTQDYKACKDLDVVVIENLVVYEEDKLMGLLETISMCETFIREGIYFIDRVYMRALSITEGKTDEKDPEMLVHLQGLGYQVVDQEEYIMLKELAEYRVYA